MIGARRSSKHAALGKGDMMNLRWRLRLANHANMVTFLPVPIRSHSHPPPTLLDYSAVVIIVIVSL